MKEKLYPVFLDGIFRGFKTAKEVSNYMKNAHNSALEVEKNTKADHVIYAHHRDNTDGINKTYYFYSGLIYSDDLYMQKVACLENVLIYAIHRKDA